MKNVEIKEADEGACVFLMDSIFMNLKKNIND